MDEHIGVFVAWPYANGDLHLGHIAGAYLPAILLVSIACAATMCSWSAGVTRMGRP